MEHISTGLVVTIIGMGIVFLVLILLWLVLELMRIIFSKEKKEEISTAENVVQTPVVSTIEQEQDDDELVAVIAAAIAASLGTSTYNLKIASIKRTGEGSPIWNRAGKQQIINKSL